MATDMYIDWDDYFTCPDCNVTTPAVDLAVHEHEKDGIIYICRNCGCVIPYNEIERQLGKED